MCTLLSHFCLISTNLFTLFELHVFICVACRMQHVCTPFYRSSPTCLTAIGRPEGDYWMPMNTYLKSSKGGCPVCHHPMMARIGRQVGYYGITSSPTYIPLCFSRQ